MLMSDVMRFGVERTHISCGAGIVARLALRGGAGEAGGREHAVVPVDGPLHEDHSDHVPSRVFPWA